MRGAIACLEVKELPQLINDIEEKTNAERLQHYDLAIASVVSQFGGQVARSIERGYLIILPNVKAAIPCAEELRSFAKTNGISQKIAIDFGDVWKLMRAHGNDYCGRRVNRCRELLSKTKIGEVTITSSFVEALPGAVPTNIIDSPKDFAFNNRKLPVFLLR
jgi:class 3 adenylate cyclase